MNRLRNRLVLVFLAATLVPLAATLWISTSLLEHSLRYASTARLDRLSQALERTGREYYQHARESLRQDAEAGRIAPQVFPEARADAWPGPVREFAESGAPERFNTAGANGDRLDYMVRRGRDVWLYSAPLAIGMGGLAREIRDARDAIQARQGRDLRRGFTYTFIVLAAAVWLVSLALLVYLAHRVSRPIQRLTAGLARLAAGDLGTRVTPGSDDEVGRAIQAFNEMAADLQHSRDRLVYLTQMASWQMLARKMAHEVKNSLTPIRLTVEEMVARQDDRDRSFMSQAAQIVVEEVEGLERRIRAFSQFAAEPPVHPAPLDADAVLQDRIGFLRSAHPEVDYSLRLGAPPPAWADEDLVKGILVNLLENAAHAAGERGRILGVTASMDGKVAIEIHDSGPGLSEAVRESLFEPTISFKKGGMGLGLSIARKSALLSGGDLEPIPGELGGAAFRLVLPAGKHELPQSASTATTAPPL